MVTERVRKWPNLNAVVTELFSIGNLALEFGSKVHVFAAFVETSQVSLAFVAVCCPHCFRCRFVLELDLVVKSFQVVRENRLSMSSARCGLCMTHVPHSISVPCLQNQACFPLMTVPLSCLRRVKILRFPMRVVG